MKQKTADLLAALAAADPAAQAEYWASMGDLEAAREIFASFNDLLTGSDFRLAEDRNAALATLAYMVRFIRAGERLRQGKS